MKLRTTAKRAASEWKLDDMKYHMYVRFLVMGEEVPTNLRCVQMSSRQLICTVRTPSCTTDTIVETPEDMDPRTLVMRPWLSNRVHLWACHRKRDEWNTLLASLTCAVRDNDLAGAKVAMGDFADLLICRAPNWVFHPLPISVVTMIKREAMKPGWSCGATEAVLKHILAPGCDGDPSMVRLLHSWDPFRADKARDIIRGGLYLMDLSARNPDNWRRWYPGYYTSAALVDLLGLEMPLLVTR